MMYLRPKQKINPKYSPGQRLWIRRGWRESLHAAVADRTLPPIPMQSGAEVEVDGIGVMHSEIHYLCRCKFGNGTWCDNQYWIGEAWLLAKEPVPVEAETR